MTLYRVLIGDTSTPRLYIAQGRWIYGHMECASVRGACSASVLAAQSLATLVYSFKHQAVAQGSS